MADSFDTKIQLYITTEQANELTHELTLMESTLFTELLFSFQRMLLLFCREVSLYLTLRYEDDDEDFDRSCRKGETVELGRSRRQSYIF